MYSASMLELFVFVCVTPGVSVFLTNHALRRLLKPTWHRPAKKHNDFADLSGLDKICFCDMPATGRLGPMFHYTNKLIGNVPLIHSNLPHILDM